ncbi:MAG: hypothetical protein FJ038_01905 [Chloroflexi bacterium]|nr:hypothetical protein [Chloroflexota bacterium]
MPGARPLLVILDLAVKVAAVALALFPLLDPTSSHFAGKAMGVRALIYPLATLLIPLAWWLRGRPRPYPFLADVALVLPFVFDAAANVLGLFAIPMFDALPHALGWLFLTLAFGLAIGPLVDQRWVAAGLSIGFGAVADIAWEIGEFLLAQTGSSGLQLTYANTIQDLGLSLLGSVIGAGVLVTFAWHRPGTPHTAFGWRRP